jgi:glycosyltransferase involved in cell wall biosynthesis
VRVLYLSPGHHAHDDRFVNAIAALGHDPVLSTAPLEAPGELARLLAKVRPGMVQAGPLEPLARLALAAGARPLVAMSWGFDLLLDEQGPAGERIAWTASHSDALLVDCRAAADVALTMGVRADRIFTLPWGVDLARFQRQDARTRASRRHRMGWDDKVVVISARAHEPLYRVEVVIEGFAAAARTRPELRLLVLGEGSETQRLREVARERCADGAVLFVGRVPNSELPEYLGAADVYVAASRVDGSSVTLLEAMAVGLPVLVSDIPGSREWVEPPQNGLLFPVDDPASLASGLVRLGADPYARGAMGASGRRLIEQRADWQKNIHTLDEAYRVAEKAMSEGL